ncbi:MAG: hypothetical protein K2Y71_23395 [Xanthobacteraceae bacterium]|nr:hypothetical protein [Xanthobacteraceae bacterium]
MRAQLNQEIINDTANLIMHRLIARSLARDPTLISRARASHSRISRRFLDRSFVAEWDTLLRLPACQLRALLTCRTEQMKRLRLSSPFTTAKGVDFSSRPLRHRIRQAAKRIAMRASLSAPESGHDSVFVKP